MLTKDEIIKLWADTGIEFPDPDGASEAVNIDSDVLDKAIDERFGPLIHVEGETVAAALNVGVILGLHMARRMQEA